MPNKKTKAIVKKEKKNLVWTGAQRLMERPASKSIQEWDREKKLILLASKVLNVSPFGVNILGSVPYINKLGLMQKSEQYSKGLKFEYCWVQYAKDDNEKAICSCTIKDLSGKVRASGIIGECSPSTMKMSTLKGYQNHMAQTRARNRAILEAFGTRMHNEMMGNIAKIKEMTGNEAQVLGLATSSSAEEMGNMPKMNEKTVVTDQKPPEMGTDHVAKLKAQLVKMGAKDEASGLKIVNDKAGLVWKNFEITQKQAQLALFTLLNPPKKW